MARPRKRRMKLPNGFGSIKYLGEGRRNPYAAYPPVKEYIKSGPITPKAICYKPTWEEAYEMLTAYNMEKSGKIEICNGIFNDTTPLFSEIYENFYNKKYNNPLKTFSNSTIRATKSAYNNCSSIHNKKIGSLTYDELQDILDNCELGHSSIENILNLIRQIYKYGIKRRIIKDDISRYLYIAQEDDNQHGIPFTDEELKILWTNKDNEIVQMLLIMCYSGYRIAAYKDIETNIKKEYFKGGIKNKTSRERIVPIHTCILPLVRLRFAKCNNLLGCSTHSFRIAMYDVLESIGIQKHTPHDCRHTFSALCERYGVNENDRKRMLGHSFGKDITNSVYGHRTAEDLKKEIEKIKIPALKV